MTYDHPYRGAPDYAFWRRSLTDVDPASVDPVVKFPFQITPEDKVAAAGSCFAQHISRYLAQSGYQYLVTEPGHPILTSEAVKEFNYGVFSARYGNIYTSRQLVQLVRRAYGTFTPLDDVWVTGNGRLIDPYRPTIQPNGFSTTEEFRRDREQHYAAVREILETADYFVFTLGLTEGWINRADGAAYPVCPGVSGGQFDPERHVFHNEDVQEVVANLNEFIASFCTLNSQGRIILTVSPVPLAATAEDHHVLCSTTYSKSVLRVAAETVSKASRQVAYFPSYEVITGNFSRGSYYAANLRDVVEDGVKHVMKLFFKHATVGSGVIQDPISPASIDVTANQSEMVAKVICDEELLEGSDLAAPPTADKAPPYLIDELK